MKNLSFWILLTSLGFLFSCEEEETLFEGPYHVRFTEMEGSVLENYNYPFTENQNLATRVSVHLVGPQMSDNTEITFEMLGDAKEGEDYILIEPESQKLVIPPNESFAYLYFVPLNNQERDGDREILFNITGVNNGLEKGRGLNGIIGKTMRYTLQDDDCLADLRKMNGLWEAEETVENDTTVEARTHEFQVDVDFDFNNRIRITNFAGIEGASIFANLDLCSKQVFIPEQAVSGGSENLGNVRSLRHGTFDEESGILRITYNLDRLGSVNWVLVATIQEE
ncbi:hypothetical protein AAG747_17440 [Rapidithrix thailandica]|uniref:DUF1735 domain-containing protein n=1 Tax=Rapidithrix thailandica TaxID=413964 RepID=A0AAW9SG80_9BACT